MIVEVNLLPEAYRQARSHERWFQWGTAAGVALLTAELLVALLLYIRAGDKRDLLASTQETRGLLQSVNQEMAEKEGQAKLVQTNVTLAKELRATHHWSRLLAALARATPDDVTLSTLSTDPARWSSGGPRSAAVRSQSERDRPTAKGKEEEARLAPSINGMVIRGYAVSHQSLGDLMTGLHKSGLFAGIDLQQMKRDQVDGREALAFELQGRW